MQIDASRRTLALATLGLGIGVLTLLALRPPSELAFPNCPVHWLSGLHCPGCGSLRAVHFLLQGEWQAALQHNLLAVLMIPLVAWLLLGEFLAAFGRRLVVLARIPSGAIWALLAVILLFGAARNLPAEPFSSLAPPTAAAHPPDSTVYALHPVIPD